MAINLDAVIFNLLGIVVGSLVVSPVLWLVGRAFVGGEKAKFSDAFWIVFLGSVISGLVNFVFSEIFVGLSALIISLIIQLIIWIGLVKHFFDTSGAKAFVVSIVAAITAAIVFAVLAWILVYLGILTGWTWL